MANMKFEVKCVKDCLITYGRVFTVRSWAGYAQESLVEVDGIGKCRKVRIGKISSMKDIARYIKLSGFASVEEWWNKVCSFGAQEGFLFLVVKV